MDEEIEAIEKNDTWDLVDLPKDENLIGVKWVYKTKLNEKGEIDRFKDRLVEKGFSQQLGIDFGETFSPVARWDIQPPGYEVESNEDKVYRLKKALYGLKQVPIALYSRIDTYMIKNGFCRSNIEPTLYRKVNEHGQILIVCLYVDDMIFTSDFDIDEFKEATMKEFEMSDLGLMKYFLGIEVEQSEKEIFICQNKYSKDLLKRFEMENCKPVPTPVATGTKLSKDDEGSDVNPTLFKRLVGSLMYLTSTRPDIMQGVSLVSRFMETPKDTHWSAGKRILRYIVGTRDCGIMYASTEKKELIGYTNSDFAGSLDDRKSTSSFVFHLGSGVISCAYKK
eukprot:PITA_34873